jgi:GNAT superfamily N-acetyltransferase
MDGARQNRFAPFVLTKAHQRPIMLPGEPNNEERLMELRPTITLHTGDLDELLPFFRMSAGMDSPEGIRHLIAIEQARGTRYYTAQVSGEAVGFIGLFFDPSGLINELEPPQIIDIAVSPGYRRQGIARALVEFAARETLAAGYDRLWLYTDGHSPALLAFYRRLGFRLVSVVPDWFGDGSAKAYLRRDLKKQE